MEYVATNVNDAFYLLWNRFMSGDGISKHDSRNGPVLVANDPVTMTYRRPRERVLFDAVRDANPFFHLFEAIWMLNGRDDIQWLAQFNKQMLTYSDDGKTMSGSNYGMRWASTLPKVIEMLRKDKMSRRGYLPLYKDHDVGRESVDIPCNLGVSFHIGTHGGLNMTVFNRSNDLLWGMLGANVVHFSFLQEYVACALGVPIGSYNQITSNLHLYTENEVTKRLISTSPMGLPSVNYGNVIQPAPLLMAANETTTLWQSDASRFIETTRDGQTAHGQWFTRFFADTVIPMYQAWWEWKHSKRFDNALSIIDYVAAADWRYAGRAWLLRRKERYVQSSIRTE